MLKLQSSSKKTKCLWQVGQIAGFEWKWRRITVHSPCSLSPWLAARGGSSNHRYKTTSNEHPPSTIVQQITRQIMREIKNLAAPWMANAWGARNGRVSAKMGRLADWAPGSLHYAPDSPWQFFMCFLKYVLSICCYAKGLKSDLKEQENQAVKNESWNEFIKGARRGRDGNTDEICPAMSLSIFFVFTNLFWSALLQYILVGWLGAKVGKNWC